MTTSLSDRLDGDTCAACGGLLPEGRHYTCNARCEAAYNEDIEEYINAAKLARYEFEKGPDKVLPRDPAWVDRDPWARFAVDALRSSGIGTGPDLWRRR
jgi:hypothetical protein